MRVTRDDLIKAALNTAIELRSLAGNTEHYNAEQMCRALIVQVDRLRAVLPDGAELTIDQRPLFSSVPVIPSTPALSRKGD